MSEVQTIVRMSHQPAFREALKKVVAKQIVNAMIRMQPLLEMHFQRHLTDVFKDLGEVVADTYLAVERPIIEAPTTSTADVRNLIEHILSSSRLRDWASDRLQPSFRDHWGLVANATARALQQSGALANVRAEVASSILEMGGRRAGLVDIKGDTRTALLRVFDQALEAGLGPRETARLIQEVVPEGRFVNAGSRYRAQLIARTETLHAQRMSSIEQYRGMPTVKMVIAFDGSDDPDCASRNGQEYTIDDAEAEAMNEHPNGTLAFGPIAA